MTGRAFRVGALALAATLSAGAALPAGALPPLSENAYVVDRLLAGRVADRIRTDCPDISARVIRAWLELRSLKSWAVEQGYAPDEIDAFVKNRAAKDALKAKAEAYLAANGATDEAGVCALGREEIAKGSLIGLLLYED
ncbi:MAG: DUF5333 domain-containing protein [Paracoccaceae bacterium]